METVPNEYKCIKCNLQYKTNNGLWKHNKKYHVNSITTGSNIGNISSNDSSKKYTCIKCNKEYNNKFSKYKHQLKCKLENNIITKNDIIELRKPNIMDNNIINNQLINIIMDKNKIIEELKNNQNGKLPNNEIIKEEIIVPESLILNDVVIISRTEDNYINATQLCQAGYKKFHDWIRLDITDNLINELESETGIPASQLIDTKKGNSSNFQQGSWIHPDLAIQLAQWISPKFALQVSKWIRTLFNNGKVEINIKLLKEQEKEIKLKNQKIQLLQDMFLKKQQRKDYPERNVIYILTTEDNKKKRIYIVGKAKKLKIRLSSYNKTAEHKVVYYKECKNEEQMNIIENMVLNKLEEYREKANRDRFILPLEKEISFFTDIINNAINFF